MGRQTRQKQQKRRKAKLKNIRQRFAGRGTTGAQIEAKPETDLTADFSDADVVGTEVLCFESLRVSCEPMPDPAVERLPEPVRERINELAHAIFEDPERHVEELRQLAAEYPHIPQLHNHLAIALRAAGAEEEFRMLAAEIARRFPSYTFGFVCQLQCLLEEDRIDEARDMLENGPRGPMFLISVFDRTRDTFHISEVLCYQAVVGMYLARTKRLDEARTQLKLCRDLDSDHHTTRALERCLRWESATSLWKRMMP